MLYRPSSHHHSSIDHPRSIRLDTRRIESFAHQSSPKWIEWSKRFALSQFHRGNDRKERGELSSTSFSGSASSSATFQNNRYSIPACRLASPPLSSASLIFPSVLHVPTRCPRPTKVWIIALCRRSGSSRLAAGMTLGSNRGSAPLSRAGESWRGGELVSLTSTKGRGHSDGRTVTIRRATRSNSGSRKFGAVATVILKD